MTLENRVAMLERSAKRWRIGFVVLLVVTVLVGADGKRDAADSLKGDAGFERVIAKQLILIDDDGDAFFSALRDPKTGIPILTVGNKKSFTSIIAGLPKYFGQDLNHKNWEIAPATSQDSAP